MTMRANSISIEHENRTYQSECISLCLRLTKFQTASLHSPTSGLKEAFALFDRVGGGMISTKDLAAVMRSIGYQTTPSQLDAMIREVDRDGLILPNCVHRDALLRFGA